MSAGFEYRNKKNETPFETFLRYTNEKEQSATELAKIFQERLGKDAHILDIGTGNGEYLSLALPKTNLPDGVKLTLVEPSSDLNRQLEDRFGAQFGSSNLKIISSDIQSFDSNEQFDIILMSHLFYHVPRTAWGDQLAKAISLLKQNGALIIVLREQDDVYDFKMAFKPLLFDGSFKALTIGDVLDALPDKLKLSITKRAAISELSIPAEKSFDDTVSIVEFFLNKEWEEIPSSVQQSALNFIKAKKNVFKQIDGIAIVERPA